MRKLLLAALVACISLVSSCGIAADEFLIIKKGDRFFVLKESNGALVGVPARVISMKSTGGPPPITGGENDLLKISRDNRPKGPSSKRSAARLRIAFLAAVADIEKGTLDKPDKVNDRVFGDYKGVLGSDADNWDAWKKAVTDKMKAMTADRKIKSMDDVKDALSDIATGLAEPDELGDVGKLIIRVVIGFVEPHVSSEQLRWINLVLDALL